MRVYDHLDPSLMDIRSEFTVKDYLSVDQVSCIDCVMTGMDE